MQKDPFQPSFGQYLRAVRIEKGVALEDVASATRISIEVLRFIEAERTTELPADVFVKGFLRAYAAEVGADGDLAVASYLTHGTPPRGTPPCKMEPDPKNRRFWIQLGLAFFGLALIIGISLVILNPPPVPLSAVPVQPGVESSTRAKNSPVQGAAVVHLHEKKLPAAAENSSVAAPSSPSAAAVSPASAGGEPHRLEIRAAENTWVKMIIDDQPPRQVSLKVGERIEFEARNGFNLLIGNAAGIRLTLNGEAVPVSGRSGQVVSLKLP